ncbi:MAG TPA: hypothetical protein VFY66_18615, partial [Anaerolineales bacterium]|nr:hypothetical protein [Anaerolineales bacterium]
YASIFTNGIEASNGVRYSLLGRTREHHFNGISFKPRKWSENASTLTTMGPVFALEVECTS